MYLVHFILELFSTLAKKKNSNRISDDLQYGVLDILLWLWLTDECAHTLEPAYEVAVLLYIKPSL